MLALTIRLRNGQWRGVVIADKNYALTPVISTIDTLLALQHPDGGFGGGPGQAAHLLPTYASICAFAIVGRPGEGGGWDAIDR